MSRNPRVVALWFGAALPAAPCLAIGFFVDFWLLPAPEAALGAALATALTALALSDLRSGLLPDFITLPLLAAGLLAAWLAGRDALAEAVFGATSGYLAFVAVGLIYRRLRGRDGLGLGDAKLLAAAGAWLGWRDLPVVVAVAALSALVAVGMARIRGTEVGAETALPFGPFLCLALWLVFVYRHAFMP